MDSACPHFNSCHLEAPPSQVLGQWPPMSHCHIHSDYKQLTGLCPGSEQQVWGWICISVLIKEVLS